MQVVLLTAVIGWAMYAACAHWLNLTYLGKRGRMLLVCHALAGFTTWCAMPYAMHAQLLQL